MQTTCTSRLNIIITGAPGSGKGTQAKKIADYYGLKHITSGELLRMESERDTKLGKKIKNMMTSGELLSDGDVEKLLKEHVPEDNFILDGYPRKSSQTDTFKDIDVVIYLDLPKEIAIEHILKRKEKRPDDNEEVAKVSLRVFAEETKPVIDFYSKKGILVQIDGNQSADDVFSFIKEAIYKKLQIG